MELKRYVAVLWRWWWLILLGTGLAVGFSYWGSAKMPLVYRTTTTVQVGQFLSSDNPQSSDIAISQQLAQYYAQVVRRQSVMQATAKALGLDRSWGALMGQVNVVSPAGTNQIQISVVDGDPQQAKRIADEIARQLILQSPTPQKEDQDQQRQFVDQQLASLQAKIMQAQAQVDDLEKKLTGEVSALQIQDIHDQTRALEDKITSWQTLYNSMLGWLRGSRTNYLSVAEPAFLPTSPVSPTSQLNLLLAASIGFLLALFAAFLLEYLDDRLRAREDVDRVLALPVLGSIVGMGKLRNPTDSLVCLNRPSSPLSEAYRLLRTNVQLARETGSPRTLLVTSAGPREGRSLIAANLAVSLAQAGNRTILVDADLRHPSLHTLFDIPNGGGLTWLLSDGHESDRQDGRQDSPPGGEAAKGSSMADGLEACLVTRVRHLRILPSGSLSDSPGDLLASSEMDHLLQALESMADVVILDGPPVLASADAAVLAAKGLGVVLVVDAGRTRGKHARLARQLLSHATVLGVVLNRAPRGSAAFRQTGKVRSEASKPSRAETGATSGALPAGSNPAWRGEAQS